MKHVTPLLLAAVVLGLGALAVTLNGLTREVQRIPKPETHTVKIMEPQEICLTKTWFSSACGEVTVKTTYREQGHGNETYEQFVARHMAAIAGMMMLCPED